MICHGLDRRLNICLSSQILSATSLVVAIVRSTKVRGLMSPTGFACAAPGGGFIRNRAGTLPSCREACCSGADQTTFARLAHASFAPGL